ncbi:MAG TPA: site-specific integrase, partial [Verrucomicrobiae bacterium]|nr:site-specific integrase [Verrucomicrobiae bacterium]
MKIFSATKNGLRRHIQSGTYYINVTVNGRHIGESTGTTSLKVARIIADKRLVELRGVQADRGRVATLGDCANIWQGRLEGRNVTALTLNKHLAVLASIKKSWPEAFGGLFDSQSPASVVFDDLLGWRKVFCKPAKGRPRHHDYANRAVWILREMFEIAREFGAYTRANPTGRMELLSGPRQDLVMPTDEQMAALIEELRHGEPHAPKAVMEQVADYCQGLAWTGLRRNEALALRREHVDLEAWRIYLPAHLVKGAKNGRIVPILAEARPLFERLCQACTPE